MKVSIIISTRNRDFFIGETLKSLKTIFIPDGLKVELIIMDNGSTDYTANIIKSHAFQNITIRYFYQPLWGKTYSQNIAVENSEGSILLFTDDDIRFPENWLLEMIDPILNEKTHLVCGGVKIAPHLVKSWYKSKHRSWLASTEWISRGNPESMVGANMAISKEISQKLPKFDINLGPGSLGFGDDHLFAMQALSEGYKIYDLLDVKVEHHFDQKRLLRDSWIKAAKMHGKSDAYIGHHWHQWRSIFTNIKYLFKRHELYVWRLKNKINNTKEGCELKEMNLVYENELLKMHLNERLKKRMYCK
jgi:glycosyltransferase involved in cell wall biosynthesis